MTSNKAAARISNKQLNIKIFADPAGGPVLWQPRIEFWEQASRANGTLPEHMKNFSPMEIFDDLGCSPRPYGEFLAALKVNYQSIECVTEMLEEGKVYRTRWKTPVGELEQVMENRGMWHWAKWAVESPADFPALEYVLRDRFYTWDVEMAARAAELVGERAAAQIYIPRTNIMQLMIEWMGVEPTMFALMQEPEKTEHLIQVINESEEQMLRLVAESDLPIINYGDNVDCNLATPPYVERYLLPQYARRGEVLRGAGKFVFAHWDGSLRSILKYLKDVPLDGVEALTPVPQGDVTIEEMREAVPEKMVLLDGIPMLHFLPSTPIEDLERDTQKLMELFGPKLILGISDEISPVCDIERVRLVTRMVEQFNRSNASGS